MKSFIKKVLPESIKQYSYLYKSFPGDMYSTNSYSQEGEDMVLKKIFETKKNGFYVDVGAHHPMRFSNTFHFYKNGWRGINIDAMPGSMKKFDKIRPKDINIECGVSDVKGEIDYYIFNETALNGCSQEISTCRDNKEDDFKIKQIVKVQTKSLEELLDEHLPERYEIDFLTIDVEGLDLNVLKSNNWKKYKPKIICIETSNILFEEVIKHDITLFLENQNYKLLSKTVYTVFYIDGEFAKKGIYC